MDTFRRDDLEFDVLDGGPPDGDPVVLLHGFPQDATAFDLVVPALHAAGLRTLAPHQRGYSTGARPRGRRAFRLEELVGDVLALLDAAGLRTTHLVGHDWGGFVAWAVAARHPERVRSLTVLSVPHPAAMARAMVTSDQALRSWYMAMFQLPVLPERMLLAGGGRALRRGFTRDGVPADVAARYVQRLQQPGALTAALNWYRALPFATGEDFGPVAAPTLHVWSTHDAALGRAATEATAGHVTGPYRLEVWEDLPHWIPELAPEATAELVIAHARSAL